MASAKVWEPCHLVFCSSFSGKYNSLLRNIIWPPCMFEISPQNYNKVWGMWWPFQNINPSFLEVLYGLF